MMKLVNGEPKSFKVKLGTRMEEQFDGLLYLGSLSTITFSELPVKLCSDSAYIEMRKRRMALVGAADWAENFKKFCNEKMGTGGER